MYLMMTGNWEHEPTPVDSSNWKENKRVVLISVKTCSFTSIDILEMSLCIVLFDRDTCLIFYALTSPRTSFTAFIMQGLISVSPILWSFYV